MGEYSLHDASVEYINEVLRQNADTPFVKRIVNPENYPVLQNKDGSHSTHSMAWGDADDSSFVYPTVVEGDKGLVRLSKKEAWDNAKKNKDYIKFDAPSQADWFSKNYKEVWKK